MARKTAPDVKVSVKFVCERKALADKYNEANPEFAHVYQAGDVSQETLTSKGMEIVKDADGIPVKHGADVLCRKSKEVFEAEMNSAAAESEKLMLKLADGNRRKVVKFRDPVRPKGE